MDIIRLVVNSRSKIQPTFRKNRVSASTSYAPVLRFREYLSLALEGWILRK